MTDRKLENRILYLILIILITVILVMALTMPISLLNIELDRETINSLLTFVGALSGAVITGATAVSIMIYQYKMNEREKHFSNYGSNKYLAVKMVIYLEWARSTAKILQLIENPPSRGLPGWEQKLLNTLPIDQFESILIIFKEERDKVPYEFVARYFTIINHLEVLISSLKNLKQHYDERRIKSSLKHLEHGEVIATRFKDNLFDFISQIEKKYDIKDYY